MLTICEAEGAPPAVITAVKRWYRMGEARLEAIAKLLEESE